MKDNQKKIFSIIFIVGLFALLNFTPLNSIYKVNADSGFDASYDSGGSSNYDSGGSSSYDSSRDDDRDSYSSSGNSSGSYNIEITPVTIGAIILSFVISIMLVTVIISNVLKTENNRNTTKNVAFLNNEEIKNILGNDFDINKFYNDAFKIYKDIQIAWMNKDLEPVRNVLTDEMFNMYKTQVMTLITKKETNIMDEINYINAETIDINNNNNKQEIIIKMEVECLDYIINDNTKEVLRGNDKAINHYIYKLTFIRTKDNYQTNFCPNCGAKLENAASTKCPYCNTIINKNSNKFVLSDKKMISQTIERFK